MFKFAPGKRNNQPLNVNKWKILIVIKVCAESW